MDADPETLTTRAGGSVISTTRLRLQYAAYRVTRGPVLAGELVQHLPHLLDALDAQQQVIDAQSKVIEMAEEMFLEHGKRLDELVDGIRRAHESA